MIAIIDKLLRQHASVPGDRTSVHSQQPYGRFHDDCKHVGSDIAMHHPGTTRAALYYLSRLDVAWLVFVCGKDLHHAHSLQPIPITDVHCHRWGSIRTTGTGPEGSWLELASLSAKPGPCSEALVAILAINTPHQSSPSNISLPYCRHVRYMPIEATLAQWITTCRRSIAGIGLQFVAI